MGERIRVTWVNQQGIRHEDVITGGRLDCSCPETTAVIRVYTDEVLTSVYTFTNVSWIVWKPA